MVAEVGLAPNYLPLIRRLHILLMLLRCGVSRLYPMELSAHELLVAFR